MIKAFLIWLFFSVITINTFADIIPDPVKVKGIVPANVPVNVQMESEVVTANLYKDSSFVECVFYMRNHGKSLELEIGFPVMNFYLWGDNFLEPQKNWLKDGNQSKFEVIVGNTRINKISLYIPKVLKDMVAQNDRSKNFKLIEQYNNANKPWYLWKVNFKEHETIKITVRYRLPAGETKSYRFFNYLLSTGAGWKDNIKSAKVILNLKDIPADQIVDTSPSKNYTRIGQQLIWNFSNIEPTVNDDIFVKYETKKGAYKAFMDKMPSIYIDGKRYKATDKIPPGKMAAYDIKKPDDVDKNGATIVYTTNYALQKFKHKMSSFRAVYKLVKKESSVTLPLNYRMVINGTSISEYPMFKQMLVVDTMLIKSAQIITDTGKQKIIRLEVSGWTKHSGVRQPLRR